MIRRTPSTSAQTGVAMISVLVLVAVAALGVQRTLTWASVQIQRDAENELVFIGQQMTRAIKAYYLNPTGTHFDLPQSLNDLVQDARRLNIRRYLRKIYPDPMTGTTQWGTEHGKLVEPPFGLRPDQFNNGPAAEGIVCVFSLSNKTPIRTIGHQNEAISTYQEWRFCIDANFVEK